MRLINKKIATLIIAINTTAAIAAPNVLVTHNTTDHESNAFIDETIASSHPTQAHSDGKVGWTEVRLACFGRTVNNICSATIKIETETENPLVIGEVKLDINTGEITPAKISGYGYSLIVNGIGETTISKD